MSVDRSDDGNVEHQHLEVLLFEPVVPWENS